MREGGKVKSIKPPSKNHCCRKISNTEFSNMILRSVELQHGYLILIYVTNQCKHSHIFFEYMRLGTSFLKLINTIFNKNPIPSKRSKVIIRSKFFPSFVCQQNLPKWLCIKNESIQKVTGPDFQANLLNLIIWQNTQNL